LEINFKNRFSRTLLDAKKPPVDSGGFAQVGFMTD